MNLITAFCKYNTNNSLLPQEPSWLPFLLHLCCISGCINGFTTLCGWCNPCVQWLLFVVDLKSTRKRILKKFLGVLFLSWHFDGLQISLFMFSVQLCLWQAALGILWQHSTYVDINAESCFSNPKILALRCLS